jgi:phosphoglycerate dehydrogenase-like enzyme
MMKPGANLINIAPGAVLDLDDLTHAMSQDRVAVAALDVTDPEPLPRDHPILTMPDVIITPHLGSATVETRRRMAEVSVTNLLAGLGGEAPAEPGYTMNRRDWSRWFRVAVPGARQGALSLYRAIHTGIAREPEKGEVAPGP